MKFKSKIDNWAHLMMIILSIQTIVMLYLTIINDSITYLIISILLLVILFFMTPIYSATYFILEDYDLVIHAGLFFHKRIPYTTITRAVKTNDMSISQCIAYSLDRLDFRYREKGQHKKLLIAPVDRDLFQRMLLLKNPMIQIDENQPHAFDEIKDKIKQSLDIHSKGKLPNHFQKRDEL